LKDLTSYRGLDIFLQGSYANHTNIRADSDVDIVVMTTHAYRGDPQRLSPAGRFAYHRTEPADFTPYDLRREVHEALIDYYGGQYVAPRNKCITVRKRAGYVDADVVPCIEYHHYQQGGSTTSYIEGISIHPLNGPPIVNFPKEHINNGQAKNGTCGMRYKPTVRQIKKLRNRAVDLGLLGDDDAPGYLLECMTYNVPDYEFVADDAQRLWDVVRWLYLADKANFMSCDGIHTLFGTDPGRFSAPRADVICKALWDAL
jgi:hypothetical protein